MEIETILPGTPEIYQEEDPIIQHLIEIRTRIFVPEDIQSVVEELRWYKSLRDNAESIPDEDRLNWKELYHRYQNLSDDQIEELAHKLEESLNGDYINH